MSLAGAIFLAGLAPSAARADAPRVRALLKAARTVVRAQVTDVTDYDNGRVVVASLRVDQTIKGTPPIGAVAVIEMRDLPTAPLFVTGRDLIAFLVPATSNTYLAKHLPKGDYMSVVKTKPGTLAARSADDALQLARLLERIAGGSQQPAGNREQRAVTTRALGFDLLAASHPLLVEDGLTTIAAIEDLSESLTDEEQQIIEAALKRSDLTTRLRILLIKTIADRGLKQLIPALRAVEAPELADASWDALSRLGAPPSEEDTLTKLASSEPAVRTAAIQQLLRQDKAAAVPRATQLAQTDPDTKVRVAAVEALGASGVPEAIPALEKVYADPTVETRQAVGRALTQVGGRPAAEAFERLAFTGPEDGQRYAVMLLLLTVQHDDPLVQRLIKTHPNTEIRELAEHGLEIHDH